MENITVKWLNDEKTILLISLNNQEWTVEDMIEAMVTGNEFVASIDHPYVTVTDTRESKGYVPSKLIPNFPRIMRTVEQNEKDRGTIIVANRGMNQIASDIFSRAMRRVTIVGSYEAGMEEAHKRLAETMTA